MRPYNSIMSIMGIMKNMQKETSNKGNSSGNSNSIEQNADSSIRDPSVSVQQSLRIPIHNELKTIPIGKFKY